MKISSSSINDIEKIIKQAGEIVISFYGKKFQKKMKSVGQIVTTADLETEDFLKKELIKIIPDAGFIAEETKKTKGIRKYNWVIDPIDGTTNFTYQIPYFCISVALTQYNEPILSAIYDPLRKDYFFAQKGNGSFLNGKQIFVSDKKKLNECLISTSIPCGAKLKYAEQLSMVKKIRCNSFAMRLFGAAALDLANVACGRIDGTFFNKLKWWDIAAGLLLIQEAGGVVTDFNDKIIKPSFSSLVAGPKAIHHQLIKYLK